MRALPEALRRARPTEVLFLRRAFTRWRGPQLPNGLPARHHLAPRMFNLHQLAIGTTVEREHTSDPAVALEIAMAHLFEDPAYYAKLERMERR